MRAGEAAGADEREGPRQFVVLDDVFVGGLEESLVEWRCSAFDNQLTGVVVVGITRNVVELLVLGRGRVGSTDRHLVEWVGGRDQPARRLPGSHRTKP